jgi:hypothetical protein
MRTRQRNMNHRTSNSISRVMGVAYARRAIDTDRGVDDDGHVWFYDVRSSCGTSRLTVQLLRTCDLTEDEGDECSIAMDKFEDVRLDCAGDAIFSYQIPSYCIGRLKCGHIFSILSIVNHMAMCNMTCAMCRDGCEKKMHMKSVPKVYTPNPKP